MGRLFTVAWLLIAAQAVDGAQSPARAQSTPVQQQSAAPKPAVANDDRPYDAQLLRLAEILGALHYLRELCGANEGQVWREQMRELVAVEGTNALRRAKFVESFNRGYRGYSRTYRTCTPPALTAIQRFIEVGGGISEGLVASDR